MSHSPNPWLRHARYIAEDAHHSQTDKSGAPYIDHPRRVVQDLNARGADDQRLAAGWLHDVVEDSNYTIDDLRREGIPDPVLEAVDLLTKKSGQSLEQYCAAIKENPVALDVKIADVEDNTDPERLSKLPEETQQRLLKKYRKTLELLGAFED